MSIVFQVHWVQQQHEKKRRKRDYVLGPSVSPYTEYISEVAPDARPVHGHPRYRAAPVVTFPDPLFREQWYLVSVVGWPKLETIQGTKSQTTRNHKPCHLYTRRRHCAVYCCSERHCVLGLQAVRLRKEWPPHCMYIESISYIKYTWPPLLLWNNVRNMFFYYKLLVFIISMYLEAC